MLTNSQLVLLKAEINGDASLVNQPDDGNGLNVIADALNQVTAAYWVWRTSVPRSDIYNNASDLPSAWSWTTYKTQQVAEQGAWEQMFVDGPGKFHLANFRAGTTASPATMTFEGKLTANDVDAARRS